MPAYEATLKDKASQASRDIQIATLAHAVESTGEMICITDLQDRFTFVNRAFYETYGYSRKELLGKSPSILLAASNPPGLLQEISRKTRAGGWRGEVMDRRKDGVEFLVSLSTSLVKDAAGRVIGLMGVARDISERKQLEQEVLEISARERRRVGHELHDGLGQFLAGIAFKAKVLEQLLEREDSAHVPAAKELVALISSAIRQARKLARGFDPIEVETIGLAAALDNLCSEAARLFHIDCVFSCHSPEPDLDKQSSLALYRIVQEAIHNATTHGRASNIKVELSTVHSRLKLSMKDDGRGFDARRNGATHSGMGLRVMKYRMGSLGGELKIKSQRRAGTEIICTLPWLKADGQKNVFPHRPPL